MNNSPYAMIYGIPVALLGLIGYLLIGLAVLLEPYWQFLHQQGPLLVLGAALVGVIFSAYLTWIELYIIFAACPFCIASAVIITLIFVLAFIRLMKQSNH